MALTWSFRNRLKKLWLRKPPAAATEKWMLWNSGNTSHFNKKTSLRWKMFIWFLNHQVTVIKLTKKCNLFAKFECKQIVYLKKNFEARLNAWCQASSLYIVGWIALAKTQDGPKRTHARRIDCAVYTTSVCVLPSPTCAPTSAIQPTLRLIYCCTETFVTMKLLYSKGQPTGLGGVHVLQLV